MALFDPRSDEIGIISLDCPNGTFPSVAAKHLPALRLERTITDLFGLKPDGAIDDRPWLDHGQWGVHTPLGERVDAIAPSPAYRFLPVEGDGTHQVAVGPVHAGIIEPGHFRFTVIGETVVRLEQRLGYVHKGIDGLIAGADLPRAAQARRPRLRRLDGGLCAGVRPRGRDRGGDRRAGRARCGCGRCAPSWSASPIISATSARSATTRRSPSCWRSSACCAKTCCAPPMPRSAIA